MAGGIAFAAGAPAFIADCMLGRLARWLRAFGFDVLYFRRIEDHELVDLARRENRILLTRDSGLIEKSKSVSGRLFIDSQRWEDQVAQVLTAFDLWDAAAPHTRCLECNSPLKPLTRERARNLVTPYVLEHAEAFALCPECGRVYWKGTHFADMNRRLDRILQRRPRS